MGKQWGLQFNETNLHWEKGYAKDWHLKDWYVEVANTTELGTYQGDVQRDENGVPLYLEVESTQDRERLQNIFKIQNVYYRKLLKYSLRG